MTPNSQGLEESFAQFVKDTIKPNVYAVGTLNQAITVGPDRRWVRGTPEIYRVVAERFVHRLSQRLYRKSYRRFKTLIPCMITLEGDRNIAMRYHMNILLRKPEWIELDRFKYHINNVWYGIDWCLEDTYSGLIVGNAVEYSLKDGIDSIIYIPPGADL